jgi:hypothetical protein
MLCFPVSQTRKWQNVFFSALAPGPDSSRLYGRPFADENAASILAARSLYPRAPGQRDGGC